MLMLAQCIQKSAFYQRSDFTRSNKRLTKISLSRSISRFTRNSCRAIKSFKLKVIKQNIEALRLWSAKESKRKREREQPGLQLPPLLYRWYDQSVQTFPQNRFFLWWLRCGMTISYEAFHPTLKLHQKIMCNFVRPQFSTLVHYQWINLSSILFSLDFSYSACLYLNFLVVVSFFLSGRCTMKNS